MYSNCVWFSCCVTSWIGDRILIETSLSQGYYAVVLTQPVLLHSVTVLLYTCRHCSHRFPWEGGCEFPKALDWSSELLRFLVTAERHLFWGRRGTVEILRVAILMLLSSFTLHQISGNYWNGWAILILLFLSSPVSLLTSETLKEHVALLFK